MDGQFATTASLHHPRLDSNNEMERWYASRDLQTISNEQYMRNRDMLIEQERIRRLEIINHSRETDNQIRLFQATRITTVNPKWWMKIKMFFQKLSLYSDQVVPITVIATTITFIVILILSKILSIW
jgi:hypothetical protein